MSDMSNAQKVDAGMGFLMGIRSWTTAKANNKAALALQKYRNGMTNIANAMNQNSITQNTTLAIQQSAKKAVFMRKDELSTLGSTSVNAAAAGVRGRSVNSTLLNVKRNAGLSEKARTDDLNQYFLQAKQQRKSSALSAVQNQDLSYLPKPKLFNYLLEAGANAAGAMA